MGEIIVRPAELLLEDPWRIPPGCESVDLVATVDGSRPRLATRCSVYRDAARLVALFSCSDAGIVATHREHDAPLWQEDVVEVFLAPETLTRYYELEVNPLGTLFDAIVDSPDGDRSTMRVDTAWDCTDCFAAIRIDRQGSTITWDTVLAIPFDALGCAAPRAAERWRGNLYRIDRSAEGDELSAWQPTRKSPPDFHVPSAFGTFVFV